MSNASERVHAYLDELSTRKTLDPEIIQNLRPEVLGEISLRVSDLHAILAALEAVEALLGEQGGYYVTDLYVHKNKLRQTITEALQ